MTGNYLLKIRQFFAQTPQTIIENIFPWRNTFTENVPLFTLKKNFDIPADKRRQKFYFSNFLVQSPKVNMKNIFFSKIFFFPRILSLGNGDRILDKTFRFVLSKSETFSLKSENIFDQNSFFIKKFSVSKFSPWHVEHTFENPAYKFLPEICKFFAHSPKMMMKLFNFSKKTNILKLLL